jgi:flagellar basal-body rod modification protein FlgD
MTTISPDTYSFSTAATTSGGATSSVAKKEDIMGKEDFLTLLVAQLKNQDPLNPDDPTEFTAQLAQFSSLEQLTNLNKSMEGLTTAQANSQKLSALSLIGKNVAYNGSSLTFDGEPVDIGYQLDGTASSVTLSVQDTNGKTVYTTQAADTEQDAGNHFITWNGTDQNGNTVADGKYKIILQVSAAGGDSSIATAPLIRSEVTGVDLSAAGNGMLTTRAGEVLFDNIMVVSER